MAIEAPFKDWPDNSPEYIRSHLADYLRTQAKVSGNNEMPERYLYGAEDGNTGTWYNRYDVDTDKDNVGDSYEYAPEYATPSSYFGGIESMKDKTVLNPTQGQSPIYSPTPQTPQGPQAPSPTDPTHLDYTRRLNSAYDNALKYGQTQLLAREYGTSTPHTPGSGTQGQSTYSDPYNIYNDYKSELDRRKSTLPDLNPAEDVYWGGEGVDPTTPFSNYAGAWEDVVSGARGTERRKQTQAFDTAFGGNGYYANDYLQDSFDDPIIDEIISPQYSEAETYLNNAKSRGMLSDVGYGKAIGDLNRDRTRERSSLSTLGTSLLDTSRSSLDSAYNRERTKYSDWDFGSTLDPNKSKQTVDNLLSTEKTRVGDQLRGSVGDRQLFNPSTYLSMYKSSSPTSTTSGSGGALRDQMLEEEATRNKGTIGAF